MANEILTLEYALRAALFGLISATSLPLGSVIGHYFKFKSNTVAIMQAFGGGALIAALSVEMVAPVVEEVKHGHSDVQSLVFLLSGGVAVGAMLTMISAALIPEANHLGNPNTVGLSTLIGFLVAVSFAMYNQTNRIIWNFTL